MCSFAALVASHLLPSRGTRAQLTVTLTFHLPLKERQQSPVVGLLVSLLIL